MPCCNAKRRLPNGIAGYVRRYGETDDSAQVAAALTPGYASFGKMVGAGVTIWAVTRVLDRLLSKGGRR